MEEYIVDFSGVKNKESFHACLKKSLPLPEWYGGNLDALYDSLTDLDEACIYFINCGQASESIPDYYDSFLDVIADAQMEVPGLFCFLEKNGRNDSVSGDGEYDAYPGDSVEEDDHTEDSGEGGDYTEDPGEEDDYSEDPGEEDDYIGDSGEEDDYTEEDPGEDDDF